MQKFVSALETLRSLSVQASAEDRIQAEIDVCLLSRSAYFEFYSWTLMNGIVDDAAEQELDRLFLESIAACRGNQYIESLGNRYDEFKDFCQEKKQEVETENRQDGLDIKFSDSDIFDLLHGD